MFEEGQCSSVWKMVWVRMGGGCRSETFRTTRAVVGRGGDGCLMGH